MPTYILDPRRMLAIHLYRAPGERNHASEVYKEIRALGLKPTLLQRNPVTDDVWILAFNFIRDHLPHAMAGTGLLGVITLWLKQRNGRGIEIQRRGLKVRASSSKELEKVLKVLDDYDFLDVTLNRAKKEPRKLVRSKRLAKKKGLRRGKAS